MTTSIENIPPKRKQRSVSSFLKKTYQMLNDSRNWDAVRWSQNGIGFVVINEDKFSKFTLPNYFKHNNYSSFVRQLNMYNFHKIRENSSESYFHHQHFNRNNKDKLTEIKRKPQKKKKTVDQCSLQSNSLNSNALRSSTLHLPQSSTLHPVPNTQRSGSLSSIKHYLKRQKKEKQPQKGPKHKTKQIKKQLGSALNTKDKIDKQERASERLVDYLENRSEARQSPSSLEEVPSSKDIYMDIDDDKVSINQDVSYQYPRVPTKELIYPSNNCIFPFPKMVSHNTLGMFH